MKQYANIIKTKLHDMFSKNRCVETFWIVERIEKESLFCTMGASKLGHFFNEMGHFHDEMGTFMMKRDILITKAGNF